MLKLLRAMMRFKPRTNSANIRKQVRLNVTLMKLLIAPKRQFLRLWTQLRIGPKAL